MISRYIEPLEWFLLYRIRQIISTVLLEKQRQNLSSEIDLHKRHHKWVFIKPFEITLVKLIQQWVTYFTVYPITNILNQIQMKKNFFILVSLLLVYTSTFAQKIPADSIFANYFKATGGKELWDGVKTYTIKRSYSAASATPYTSDISVSVPDKSIYKSKTIMNRSFIYTVKDSEGWIKVPLGGKMDVKDLSQAEQTSMRLEMYDLLVPFIDYQNRGFIATTVGTETLNGVSVNQVELQGTGVKYNLWFDAKSGLLSRQKETLAGVETVTDFSNYTKSASGVLYPAKLVEINSIDKKPVTITSTVVVNGAVNPELFKR